VTLAARMGAGRSWLSSRLSWLLLAAGLAVFFVVRLTHPINGLGNNDIAGIAYNADVLLCGGLPYVDTIEFKSPGTFFVFAGIFEFLGREAAWIHRVCAFGFLLAAGAVWMSARTLYGRNDARLGRTAAAGAVFVYLISVAGFGSNYSSWMMPAYAWAFAWLLLGLRTGRLPFHAAAGMCATFAFLLKGPAIVLVLLFPLVWTLGRRQGEPGATWHAWWAWAGGAIGGWLPIVLFYAARGALPELLEGVFPVAGALEYTGRIESTMHWAEGLARIGHQNFYTFRPAATLATIALLLGALHRNGKGVEPEPIVPQTLLWLLAIVSAGLGGMRYYPHYLVQYTPGLALLAAHPSIYRWIFAGHATRSKRVVAAVVGLWCGFLVMFQIWTTPPKGHPGLDPGNAAILAGRAIAERTEPGDRILAWGWNAWPVYFWSDRRAPTRLYKSMGSITDFNANGLLADRPLPEIAFKPGPAADGLLEAFRTTPPRFVVRAIPYFPGTETDPLDQFAALRDILDRRYEARQEFDSLRLYELVRGPGE